MSKLWTVGLQDWLHGLIIVVVSAILTYVSNNLAQVHLFADASTNTIVLSLASTLISSLLTALSKDESGKVLGKI